MKLTDADAVRLKTRPGFVAGDNAQAMGAPLAPAAAGGSGWFITAAEGTTDANDSHPLLPMITAAAANLEQPAPPTLAAGSYETAATVTAGAAAGGALSPPAGAERPAYHKARFPYDAAGDTYPGPQGPVLTWRGTTPRPGEPLPQVYRAAPAGGRACPA